ncbi:hypothetical protein [Zoogloea sp.]|uniref:hypothetical protein n=1 Tax=Zoogloea sp. TaxID=49181 RepID=UPI001415A766|nr:MAG: hypothetical protein F9K15_22035 [Zoogloea sp.]
MPAPPLHHDLAFLDEGPSPGADSHVQSHEATAEDEAALALFLARGGTDEDIDGESAASEDAFWREFEDDLSAFLDDADPTSVRNARGTPLWVGLDAEWTFDAANEMNRIISIQLHVPPQAALSTAPEKQKLARKLSRIIYATSPTREGRPSLQRSLRSLIDQALDEHLIAEAPRLVIIAGFGLRFDLAALSDFPELRSQIDAVSGKLATVGSRALMDYERPLVTGDVLEPVSIGLHFIDVAAHVPPGTSLRNIGVLLGKPKLDIPRPYSIERMDEYLQADRTGFEAYAMRDAEIAVEYAQRLADFAKKELDISPLPTTASGLALKWCMRTISAAQIDRLEAFGLYKTQTVAYHARSNRARTVREVQPTPMRRIQEAFLTDCYAGGRNEAFFIGPSPVGVWYDYDLAGAYSTGLVDLPLIDFENPRSSLAVEDYLNHVAGYALIEFEHPADTRFPVFAVSRGGKGLIFPLKGTAYATAPEIRVAHDLGCAIKVKWGVLYPWRRQAEDAEGAVPAQRLFAPFVKAARALRKKYPAKSLEEQAAKLYANSIYGKVCQALRPKNVFDTRGVRSIRLKPSPMTNPAIGSHVTGFIRAVLAEILNRIPTHRSVLSVTTDGFLCDATADEVAACLDGPLCRRFQALCDEIVPGSRMLEVKHKAGQIVCMKTRGQLTGQALPGEDIVLAKAGVQIIVDAPNNLDSAAYKALQNEQMLDLYLDRVPGRTILRHQFPSIRDQYEKGMDLYKFQTEVLLSLEPDLKRAPCNPRMIEVASRGRAHVSLDTRPWNTVEEFDAARALLDGWRRKHCLRTLDDWQHLHEAMSFSLTRSALREAGARTLNLRAGKPLSDALRRAFLRAYAHSALGLERTYNYTQVAAWLTDLGYPTKESEARSAKSQKLVLHSIPRIEGVMTLWHLLKAEWPMAELDALLADRDPLQS